MKKVLWIFTAFLLAACGEDVDTPVDIDGVYKADAMDLEITMQVKNEKCASFAVSIKGDNWHTWSDVTTIGNYPNYVYTVSDMKVKAHYKEDRIDATMDGVLHTEYIDGPNIISQQATSLNNVPIVFYKQ